MKKLLLSCVVLLGLFALADMPAVVRTLNGESGDVAITAGSNITVTPSGQTIQISATVPTPPRGPVILAEPAFLNQTDWLPSTTLFTPSSDGLYRITMYEEVTNNGTLCDPSFPVYQWTDDNGQETAGAGGGGLFSNGSSHGRYSTFAFFAKANVAVSVSVPAQCGGTAPQPYSLRFAIEQL
jgi:hypothetical protein